MHINSFQKAVDLMHRALDVNALRYTGLQANFS